MSGSLRSWLHRAPHPASVRFERADGEERTLRIGATRSKWRDAEQALTGAIRCEALADDGALLRVWQDEKAEELREESGKQSTEQAMLVKFAELLQDGCDKSVLRYEAIVGRAFDQQSVLVATLSNRLAALEKAWHELLMAQERAVEPDSDPNAGLVQTLVTAALSGGASPPPQPNGKG